MYKFYIVISYRSISKTDNYKQKLPEKNKITT